MVGKQIRLERIMNRDTGRTVIVPMDHGVTVGPINGLIDMKTTVNAVALGGANAILIHKGLVTSGHRRRGKDVGLIIHLSGSTALSPYPNAKTLVCTVEEAIKLGADIVKVSYTGSVESFRRVVRGCPVPVVIAGGPKMNSDREILEMVKGAIEAGGAGVSIGRNVFQHRNPSRMVGAMSLLVNENASVTEALSFLQG